MIHHISVAVDNPQYVAEVLSEVLAGKFCPFPPHPGSYMVFAQDEYGTGIELYPSGTELIPGEPEVQFQNQTSSTHFVPFHAAISVPTSIEEIEEIGTRAGWLVKVCNRGSFHVVEFWVENKFMLELLPSEFTREYLEFLQPQKLEALFNAAME